MRNTIKQIQACVGRIRFSVQNKSEKVQLAGHNEKMPKMKFRKEL